MLVLLGGASGADSCWNGDAPPTAAAGAAAPQTGAVAATSGAQGFLGPDDFDGDFKPRAFDTFWGGEAIYHGRVVFLHLPRSEVAKVLPSDLQLAPRKLPSEPAVHPVILLFGHQTETKLVLPIGTPQVGDDYNELILLVPFVQGLDKQRWHNYVVRMYLDDDVAIQLGNDYYGLQKKKAEFQETPARLSVTRELVEYFAFQPGAAGNWMSDATAQTTLANYAEMKEIAEMPVIGRPSWTSYICSYFEWSFANAEAGSLSGTSTFLQQFDAGMAGWVALGPVANVTDGAWQVRKIRWRMGYPPFLCEF
jgi:hypothetical protein